ncbi:hypothetical protein CALCODRAFT_518240 [Calocera cornea HHB12733]|uniref:FK506-binding protein n=1 Tax=Calocera cornea HHB12733 TaxID=1353952 RepID=A0A165F527_9BASI|nr:hypothetical protein CALCODRAFT_518240 [Calocera cornea HHB12733]
MVALSVWGLALEPGKKYDLVSEYDIHLTGVTFGEEVKGEKRSVLKVHTISFPEDDEDEDDEDDEEKEKEEDDDEMDNSELRETIVCSLVPNRIEYQNVNLVLTTSEEPVLLEVTGENTVYLSGNYVEQEMPGGDDMDDMDDDYDLEDVPSDVEVDSDEMDAILNGEQDEDDDTDEDMEGEPKIQEITEAAKPASKKRAREEEESSPAKAAEPEKKLSKAEKKRLNKKLKGEDGEAKAAPAAEVKTNGKATEGKEGKKIVELPGGVKIQDMKIGSGPQAKSGKKIGMRYIGKLQSNGKVFDSNTKGKPFQFTLGKGQVIKGWDEGVVGMAVGGERRITIPPQKAYGNKSTSDIPANSTLVFDVKMVEMS